MPTRMTAEVIDMPEWKSKVLRAVAWLLGYRGEYVYCIMLDANLKDLQDDDKT